MIIVPLSDGVAEHTEKRSRFIAHIWRAGDEAAALEFIRQTREKYYDARHNVYAYITPGAARYSDDGEPGGSAGLPLMKLLTAEGISEICCVVTRYFGGILLGYGGLQRAYVKAAKLALEAAGKLEIIERTEIKITCPYGKYERVNKFLCDCGAVVGDTEYLTDVTLTALIIPEREDEIQRGVMDITDGACEIIGA